MASQIKAGIEFKGSSLRYAEVEYRQGSYRLLRLGSCDFDFDAEQQLFGTDNPLWLSTIADALRDVFRGASSSTLSIVMHPPTCIALSMPVAPGTSEEDRIEHVGWEASLYSMQERVHVVSITDRMAENAANAETWLDAIALPPNVHGRIEQVLAAVPPPHTDYLSSDRSAANVWIHALQRNDVSSIDGEAWTLGVGCYDHHVEFFLTHGGLWHAGTYAMTGVLADYPYFAVSFLEALGVPRDYVTDLVCYGDAVNLGALAPMTRVFECEPVLLDPLKIIELESDALRVSFSPEIFVPCIGACI